MSPTLTPEEEATLRELEAEFEKPAGPAPKDVRTERFVAEPVGMGDDGELFPIPEPDPAPVEPARKGDPEG